MIYLDTNVIISFMDTRDPLHEDALKFLDSIDMERVVSMVVFLELVSVYSRAGFSDPVALAIYSIDRVGASLIGIDCDLLLRKAIVYAPMLKLRTLDLLHVVACYVIGADSIATFDEDIIRKSSVIEDTLGVKVVSYSR